jgi:hypothetical protein
MRIYSLMKYVALSLSLATISATAQVSVSLVSATLPSLLTQTAVNYKIAELPTSTFGTYDHLHLLVTVNSGWGSQSNTYIDATFANRNGLSYQYTLRGAAPTSAARLVAYSNSDGSVDVYVNFAANVYEAGGFTVLENVQDAVYTTPASVGATPPGTLIFDSSSSTYPPSTYGDFSSNLSVGGNLALSGQGASITFSDGTVQSTAWSGSLGGGDYAEAVDVTGERENYKPGDVMVVDPSHSGQFLQSSEPYSHLVSGIYSTKPGVIGRRQITDPKTSTSEVPMAMVGIVPTNVSAENGPIRAGDLLVTSSTRGCAMKGTDPGLMLGAVVGKALSKLDSGTGVIEVLVTLQ